MKTQLLAALLLLAAFAAPAQTNDASNEAALAAQMIKLVKGLHYQHGEITLRGGLAKLTVPKEFSFLDAKDAQAVLTKLWGNPPSDDTLGLLMPAGLTPLDTNCWVVTFSFAEDGYVKDDDAGKIDYADLLKKMQAEAREGSKARVKEGYPSVELIGWAAPPRYDAAAHKLYWAKELKFGGEDSPTLNYNIRMLGRRGVLVLNAIAAMNQLPEIEQQTPTILTMVNFTEGHRYADFDASTDKVATYGLAALVAGGIATKLGFFKLLIAGLIAAKKFVIIGLIAGGAWLKKLFGRNKDNA